MHFINYLLTALIAFSGLFLGHFLALIAKEEVKKDRKHLLFLQKTLFSVAVLATIAFAVDNIYLTLILLGALLYFPFSELKCRDIAIYVLLAFTFFLNSRFTNLFLLQAALIFLHGFPTGSLIKQPIKSILFRHIWFIPIALLLFWCFR